MKMGMVFIGESGLWDMVEDKDSGIDLVVGFAFITMGEWC